MEIDFGNKDELQAAFNELTEACKLSLEAAKDQKDLNIKLKDQVQSLLQSNIEFNDALKNIYSILNSKKDLWSEDNEFNDFMDNYAAWILSSGSIKLSVMGRKK